MIVVSVWAMQQGCFNDSTANDSVVQNGKESSQVSDIEDDTDVIPNESSDGNHEEIPEGAETSSDIGLSESSLDTEGEAGIDLSSEDAAPSESSSEVSSSESIDVISSVSELPVVLDYEVYPIEPDGYNELAATPKERFANDTLSMPQNAFRAYYEISLNNGGTVLWTHTIDPGLVMYPMPSEPQKHPSLDIFTSFMGDVRLVNIYYKGNFKFSNAAYMNIRSWSGSEHISVYINGMVQSQTFQNFDTVEFEFEPGVEYEIEYEVTGVEPYIPFHRIEMYPNVEVKNNQEIHDYLSRFPNAETFVVALDKANGFSLVIAQGPIQTETILFLLSNKEIKWDISLFDTQNVKAIVVSSNDGMPLLLNVPDHVKLFYVDNIPSTYIQKETCSNDPSAECDTPEYSTMKSFINAAYGVSIHSFIGIEKTDWINLPAGTTEKFYP